MSLLAEPALIMLISAGACVAAGRLAIPVLVRAQRMAPARYEDCPPLLAYQQRKQGTPTLGGLFVLFTGIAVASAAGGLSHRDGWIVLGAVLAMGVVGLVDDGLKFRGVNARGLRMKSKLLMTLAVGAVVGLFSRSASPIGWLWVPFAMVVLAGCAHAVNLTDGMDGLAAGCVAIALAVLGLIVVQAAGSRTLAVWCASLSGACLGFLWFNSFPAQVFLGDVGALGFGAALGTLGLLTRNSFWLPVIGGIFVAEALSVMLQVASYKWRGRRRLFRVAPIHHHFHLGGISEPKLIVRFWIVGAMLGLLSLARIARP